MCEKHEEGCERDVVTAKGGKLRSLCSGIKSGDDLGLGREKHQLFHCLGEKEEGGSVPREERG